jgi:hypothetical protein
LLTITQLTTWLVLFDHCFESQKLRSLVIAWSGSMTQRVVGDVITKRLRSHGF